MSVFLTLRISVFVVRILDLCQYFNFYCRWIAFPFTDFIRNQFSGLEAGAICEAAHVHIHIFPPGSWLDESKAALAVPNHNLSVLSAHAVSVLYSYKVTGI